jgi:GNAT superfamily N-acetyltransferase
MPDLNIAVRDAPAVPGLVFRQYRGPGDFPGMVAVRDACMFADDLEWPLTVADMERDFAHLVNCDPWQDIILAEVDGEMVGWGHTHWYQEVGGHRLHHLYGYVVPAWRRRGIGTAILGWQEARQRAVAATLPQEERTFYQGELSDTEVAVRQLMERSGYAIVRRWHEMVRLLSEEIQDVALPDGLEVRPATPDQYRRIWDAENEAFRDHWGFSEPKEEEYLRWVEDPVVMQPALWQIAWDGDEIAGQVKGFINHKENEIHGRLRGYCEFISVRRPWRKRGLATALIHRTLRLLKEQGMTEAALGVDTENLSGALRLYESCGFRPVKSGAVYRKPLTL